MKEVDYKNQYYELLNYMSENYNIKIKEEPFSNDAWYPFLNLIKINSNLKFKERFFTLLHESGHVVIDNQIRVNKTAICFNKNVPEHTKSKKAYVHNLNEEILAWNYGKNLVDSLGLKYDENNLEEYMTDCIMSYVKSGLKSVYGKTIDIDLIRIKYV